MYENLIGRPMEILLVEDSLIHARVTIGALKNGHVKHRLTLIRDGQEAVEFLRRIGKFSRAPRPDLVLLDLRLPKLDGLEVLAEIRADDDLQDLPVVVMTASDDDSDREQCELFGVASYVPKPVNLDKFLMLVRQLKRYWSEDVILPTA
ncbi:response regulator [Lignipirellula cremea]|uniref:Response regulator rcp1 n=1 Tax=Lignipirellula cremea TaxID=2528010 RepID=A0A518DT48_9BACT|nr:response regulator [Lignipirellula cremea]QDU95010.1 Response regulator rcp1 [Lignipirellula cremea]